MIDGEPLNLKTNEKLRHKIKLRHKQAQKGVTPQYAIITPLVSNKAKASNFVCSARAQPKQNRLYILPDPYRYEIKNNGREIIYSSKQSKYLPNLTKDFSSS